MISDSRKGAVKLPSIAMAMVEGDGRQNGGLLVQSHHSIITFDLSNDENSIEMPSGRLGHFFSL